MTPDEEALYVKAREEQQGRVIAQSMDRKLGNYIPLRDQVNPWRSKHTDNGAGVYSPLKW